MTKHEVVQKEDEMKSKEWKMRYVCLMCKVPLAEAIVQEGSAVCDHCRWILSPRQCSLPDKRQVPVIIVLAGVARNV